MSAPLTSAMYTARLIDVAAGPDEAELEQLEPVLGTPERAAGPRGRDTSCGRTRHAPECTRLLGG